MAPNRRVLLPFLVKSKATAKNYFFCRWKALIARQAAFSSVNRPSIPSDFVAQHPPPLQSSDRFSRLRLPFGDASAAVSREKLHSDLTSFTAGAWLSKVTSAMLPLPSPERICATVCSRQTSLLPWLTATKSEVIFHLLFPWRSNE